MKVTFPATVLAPVVASLSGTLAGTSNLITSTCKKSDDYAQCVEMLGTDERSARATTVGELAGIGIDVATDNAWRTSGFFDIAARKERVAAMADALRRCGSYYDDAVYELKTASENFDARLYKHARAQAGNAENVGNHGAQEFVDRRLKPAAAVDEANKQMRDWTTIAGDLVDLLVTS